jgi:hypothetical protein
MSMLYELTDGSDPVVVFIPPIGTDGASWQPAIACLGSGAATLVYDRPATD